VTRWIPNTPGPPGSAWTSPASSIGHTDSTCCPTPIGCGCWCACTELAATVEMTATAASHALRQLRHQGWVTASKSGRIVRYRLADETIHRLLHWIGATHASEPSPP
jgi:DNA-binding transcriptional ArsR family regulator